MSSANKQPKHGEESKRAKGGLFGTATGAVPALSEPVIYDVEGGLQRHRQLVLQQTQLPDWASEPVAPGGAGLRAVLLGTLGGLFLVLGYVLWQPAQPAPLASPAAHTPSASSARLPEGARPAAELQVVETPRPPPTTTDAPRQAALEQGDLGFKPTQEPARSADHEPRLEHARSDAAPLAAQAAVGPTRRELPSAPRSLRPHAAASKPATIAAAPASAPEVAALQTTMPSEPKAGPAPSAPVAQPPARVAQPEVEPAQPEVLAEMEQLRLAEQQLARQPARTLAIVRAGFQRFRPGYLNQERRYLEVMALLGMGMRDDARLLGREFVRDYPAGPYRRKVETALAQ